MRIQSCFDKELSQNGEQVIGKGKNNIGQKKDSDSPLFFENKIQIIKIEQNFQKPNEP